MKKIVSALDLFKKSFQIPAAIGMRIWSSGWSPHSRLILVKDSAAWVIDEEMRALVGIASTLGFRLASSRWLAASRQQAVFYGSQFYLLSDEWLHSTHRIGVAYFHGKPCSGVPEFDELFYRVSRYHDRLARVQVSHSEMRDQVLSTGITPDKVQLIPIGVNLSYFCMQTPELKRQLRNKFGIPQSAVVIGSFQKDGVGWNEGLEPKLIKGPDTFLKTVAILKNSIRELFIVLSGPARGYIRSGLERLGIPYLHFHFPQYSDIGRLYQTLDLYLVTARQEGGPKAILESMASGVPIVSTRVGQAMDLVQHGQNGFIVETEDIDGLAEWAQWVLMHPSDMNTILLNGRNTAEANSYESQVALWEKFFDGFVEYGQKGFSTILNK